MNSDASSSVSICTRCGTGVLDRRRTDEEQEADRADHRGEGHLETLEKTLRDEKCVLHWSDFTNGPRKGVRWSAARDGPGKEIV